MYKKKASESVGCTAAIMSGHCGFWVNVFHFAKRNAYHNTRFVSTINSYGQKCVWFRFKRNEKPWKTTRWKVNLFVFFSACKSAWIFFSLIFFIWKRISRWLNFIEENETRQYKIRACRNVTITSAQEIMFFDKSVNMGDVISDKSFR